MAKLLIPCVYLFIIACESNDVRINTEPIDSDILLEVREELGSDSRELALFCKTKRLYPCSNFPIVVKKRLDKNSMWIDFTAVEKMDLCETAFGPAAASVNLGSLPNGEYKIQLNNGDKKNKGTIKITDTDFLFLFGMKEGISFVRADTKRVPDKTYWVTVGYHEQSSSALVDEFIQQFVSAGAAFNKQLPGHYFYYEIDQSGDILASAEFSGYLFLRKLIFQYDGDEGKLRDIIQVEGKKYKNKLSMRMDTFKGETFYNWGN